MSAWTDEINPEIHFIWHGESPAGWVEPTRRLFDNELMMVTRGSCVITICNQPFRCGPGDYVIVPPDTLHATHADSRQGVYRYCIHFNWNYTGKPRPATHCVIHPALIPAHLVHRSPAFVPRDILHGKAPLAPSLDLLGQLAIVPTSTNSMRRVTGRALFLQLLLLILALPSARKPDREQRSVTLALQVRELLSQPVNAQQSVRELLETLGHSYGHLCRLFRQYHGVTPVAYLNAMRVERAKILLRNSQYSARDIATMAGFSSPQYFSRVFRRLTGMTPGNFA